MNRRNLTIAALVVISLIGLWELRVQLQAGTPPAPVTEVKGPKGPPKLVLLIWDPAEEYGGYRSAAEKGARAAIQAVNASGGVRSSPLELASVAFGADLPTGTPLFAMYTGGEGLAANVVLWAEQAKIPLLLLNDGPCMTVTPSSEGKASPYIWSLGLSWETTLESFFVYLSDQFSPAESDFTFFYVAGDVPDNQLLISAASQASESLGFKTMHSQFFDTRLADYYPLTRDIIARRPNITFLANRSLSGKLFLQQASKLSLYRETHLVGLSSLDPELFEGRLQLLEKTYTVGRYDPTDTRPENKSYRDNLLKIGAGAHIIDGSIAESAYTAIQLGAAARTNASGDDANSFAKGMLKAEWVGPNGKVKMNAQNHVLEQPMFVLQSENGERKTLEKLGVAIHPNLDGCEVEPPMPVEEHDELE